MDFHRCLCAPYILQQVLNKKGKDLGQAIVPISLALQGDTSSASSIDSNEASHDEEEDDDEFDACVNSSERDFDEEKDERDNTPSRGKRMRFRLASGGAFKGWLTLDVFVKAVLLHNEE